MTPDDHLDELLGAYALDAVDDLERRRVEAYLAEHAEARAEVWQMRQAASMLAHSGNPAPDRIWDRIADTLEERPPDLDRPLPAPKSTGRRRPLTALLAAAAVLIAAAAGVVTALVLDAADEPETTQSIEDAYESARDDPTAASSTCPRRTGRWALRRSCSPTASASCPPRHCRSCRRPRPTSCGGCTATAT